MLLSPHTQNHSCEDKTNSNGPYQIVRLRFPKNTKKSKNQGWGYKIPSETIKPSGHMVPFPDSSDELSGDFNISQNGFLWDETILLFLRVHYDIRKIKARLSLDEDFLILGGRNSGLQER